MTDIYSDDRKVVRIYPDREEPTKYTISDWTRICHNVSRSSGGWSSPKTTAECAAFIHMDISNALMEAMDGIKNKKPVDGNGIYYEGDVPCGVSIELAGCISSILDYCGRMGWDMDKVMRTKVGHDKSKI